MTFLIVIVWGIIGFIAGGMIAAELAPLFRVRHMEGASAYFGVMTGSPLGLIVAGFLSYRKSRSYGEDSAKRSRFFVLTLCGVAALVIGIIAIEKIRTADHLDSMIWVNCRVRLPAGMPAPDTSQKVIVELRSDKETRKSSPYSEPKWEMRDGRMESYASVEAYRATDKRKIALTIGTGPTYVYALRAPARPKTYSYEGEWQRAETVEGGEDKGVEARCGM